MSKISSLGALPDPGAGLNVGQANNSAALRNAAAAKVATPTPATDETQTSPLQAQLTRLSGVLNSLQTHASATRTQFVQALNKVKSGTYQVDTSAVSRSIVDDLLHGSNS